MFSRWNPHLFWWDCSYNNGRIETNTNLREQALLISSLASCSLHESKYKIKAAAHIDVDDLNDKFQTGQSSENQLGLTDKITAFGYPAGFGLPIAETMPSACVVIGYHDQGDHEFMVPTMSTRSSSETSVALHTPLNRSVNTFRLSSLSHHHGFLRAGLDRPQPFTRTGVPKFNKHLGDFCRRLACLAGCPLKPMPGSPTLA